MAEFVGLGSGQTTRLPRALGVAGMERTGKLRGTQKAQMGDSWLCRRRCTTEDREVSRRRRKREHCLPVLAIGPLRLSPGRGGCDCFARERD